MSTSVMINPDMEQIVDYDNRLELLDEYEKEEGDVLSGDENIVGERLRGDGQEQDLLLNKKVDDDEDRRNPQYIPKRGIFYEHDDRTLDDPDAESNEEEADPNNENKIEKDAPKVTKKVWEEKDGEKWGHDLYIEKEQLPKSKQELVNAYGYDIRNEDGPPRARRRRRYGRGPNKYTRNWEDEDAYTRSQHQVRTKKNNKNNNPPTKEDFPPLNAPMERSHHHHHNLPEEVQDYPPPPSPSHYDGSGDASSIPKVHKKERNMRPKERLPKKIEQEEYYENIQQELPPPMLDEQRSKKFSTKPQKVSKEVKIKTKDSKSIASQSYSNSNRTKQTIATMTENDCYQLTREMGNLKMDAPSMVTSSASTQVDIPIQTTVINSNRQSSVPPRLQNEQRLGPKRYSSLRQRSLPETIPQPAQYGSQPSGYYQDYPQSNQQEADHPIMQQLHQMVPPPVTGAPNVPHNQQLLQQQSLIAVQQQQVSHHQQHLNVAPQSIITHTLPPQTATSHQQPLLTQQALLSAAASQHMSLNAAAVQSHSQYGGPPPQAYQVPPAASTNAVYNMQQSAPNQYIPPQQPMNPVYAATPQVAQPPPQYPPGPYPPYPQAFTAPLAQPPQDLYQTPSGITYYSPHSQTASARAPPLKRPKAAIPILAPPERQAPRGRGRCSPTEMQDRNKKIEEYQEYQNVEYIQQLDSKQTENAKEVAELKQDTTSDLTQINKE